MTRILVTGATGFVGRAIVSRLERDGFALTLGLRRPRPGQESNAPHRQVAVGDLSALTDWDEALHDCDVVVHLAGQTPGRGVAEQDFRVVNDEGTGRLAQQAAASGVRLFILMSSMAAITGTAADGIVSDATTPAPVSPYGRTKLAAEGHVADFSGSGRVGVSLRPPMVYGAAAGGSWGMLQRLAATGLPLPFGAVRNRRSALSIVNLTDAVAAVVSAGEEAPAGAFAVSDSEPVGLSEMLCILREGMGLPRRLVPVPPPLLSAPLRLAGKGAIANSLLGDLVIDAGRFREAFGWTPPEDVRQAIRRSGADYAAATRSG